MPHITRAPLNPRAAPRCSVALTSTPLPVVPLDSCREARPRGMSTCRRWVTFMTRGAKPSFSEVALR